MTGLTSLLTAAAVCFWEYLCFILPAAGLLALPTAALGAWVELVTHGGNDTVTVPAAHCTALLLLHFLL